MSDELHFKKIETIGRWTAPEIRDFEAIPKGDMPGDKISINSIHVKKAQIIFPRLLELVAPILNHQVNQRAVIAVHGGSGVGKSEIGSLLAFYLNAMGIGSYILSGDNYPHRIPKINDDERLRVFCEAGIKGLTHYLGSSSEINFAEVNAIIANFKAGAISLKLKRMGREEKELWYDDIDLSKVQVIVIEWTHGNNDALLGVDIPILLNSTPQETLEHRRQRNRDGGVDSPLTALVLGIEQELLRSQAKKAKIIVAKSGDIMSYADFIKAMA